MCFETPAGKIPLRQISYKSEQLHKAVGLGDHPYIQSITAEDILLVQQSAPGYAATPVNRARLQHHIDVGTGGWKYAGEEFCSGVYLHIGS